MCREGNVVGDEDLESEVLVDDEDLRPLAYGGWSDVFQVCAGVGDADWDGVFGWQTYENARSAEVCEVRRAGRRAFRRSMAESRHLDGPPHQHRFDRSKGDTDAPHN